jgi:hypothetical protein
MRCTTCQQISIADFRFGGEVLQQPSFAALKQSSESGCDLCTLSYTAVVTDQPKNVVEQLHRGQIPDYPEDDDTGVRLEGYVFDNQYWYKENHKEEQVVVRVGEQVFGRNGILAVLNVCAIEGL